MSALVAFARTWLATMICAGLVAIFLTILLMFRRRLALYGTSGLDNTLRLGAVLLVIGALIAVGLIIDNPGADKSNGVLANDQRRTTIQVAGGNLAAGALFFSAVRAVQTQQQLRHTQEQLKEIANQRLSQESLKHKELQQADRHQKEEAEQAEPTSHFEMYRLAAQASHRNRESPAHG